MARLMFLTCCVLLLLPSGCAQPKPTHANIAFNGTTWSMELAIGDAAIQRGLMDRAALDEGSGMLFVFPRTELRSFWMAWCLMPIDLVFLDGRGRVVATHEMQTEPPKRDDEPDWAYFDRMTAYPSGVPVRFAAEFPAGTINAHGFKRGDKVELDIDNLLELEQRMR